MPGRRLFDLVHARVASGEGERVLLRAAAAGRRAVEAVAVHRQRRLVETDLQHVLPATEGEGPHVLAAGPAGAVHERVPEQVGLPRRQPRVAEQLAGDEARPGVPGAAHPAVVAGAQQHPFRVAARVAVVDGDAPASSMSLR